jgi:tRNA(Ile)-lysidine synthase TilS/MesJ
MNSKQIATNDDGLQMLAEQQKKVDESLAKKFHKLLFTSFAKAIKTYKLLSPNDKVAVCVSGGKDSMLMARLFLELKKHSEFNFDLVFLVMDPGYSPKNRAKIEQNAKILNLPIVIFESDIFANVEHIEKSPCYLCARMRRGHLYAKAKELGCNKIALGHHFDDVIETILMGVLYGAQVQTMMPKLKSENFEGMELIRPMYLVRERDIISWRDYNHLEFLQCACRFTEQNYFENNGKSANEIESTSIRKKVKNLISTLTRENKQVEKNIFRSVENVNLATVIAYKDKQGKKHNFLDDYDDE